MSVAHFLLRFFEEPRGKLLRTFGLFLAAPLRELYMQDAKRFGRRAEEADVMRGRLELLLSMLREEDEEE